MAFSSALAMVGNVLTSTGKDGEAARNRAIQTCKRRGNKGKVKLLAFEISSFMMHKMHFCLQSRFFLSFSYTFPLS